MPAKKRARRAPDRLLQPGGKNFEIFFESAPAMMLVMDKAGTVVKVNRRFREVLGYRDEDVVGRPPSVFATEASYQQFLRENFPDFWQHGYSKDRRYEFVAKGGKIIPVIADAEAIVNGQGNRLGLAIMRPATKARRERNLQMLAVVEQMEAIALSLRLIARSQEEVAEVGAEHLPELVASVREMARTVGELTDAVVSSLDR